MTRSPWTRSAVVLPLAAAVLATVGGTAYAVAQARATGNQGVSVVAYGAQAALPGAASPAGPLQLLYSENSDRAPRLFVVRNTGTTPLTGQTWSLSVVNTTAGTKGTSQVHVCVGGTYTSVDTCSGGTETLVVTTSETTPAASASPALALPVGGVLSAKFTPVGSRGFTATVEMSVNRSQVRAATTSAS